jgi:hypothetical protein
VTPVYLDLDTPDRQIPGGELRRILDWKSGAAFDKRGAWVEEGEKVVDILLFTKKDSGLESEIFKVVAPTDGFLVPLADSRNPSRLSLGDPIALIAESDSFSGGVDYEMLTPESTWVGKVTPLDEHAKFIRTLEEGHVNRENDDSEEVVWGHLERNGKVVKELHRETAFESEIVYYLIENGEEIKNEEGRKGAVFLEVMSGGKVPKQKKMIPGRVGWADVEHITKRTQSDNVKNHGEKGSGLHNSSDNREKNKDLRGFVYILKHPRMPDVLKIGSTERTPEERARELSSPTGVPGPFQVLFKKAVQNPRKREMQVHELLSEYRVSSRREFFEVSGEMAVSAIEKVLPE